MLPSALGGVGLRCLARFLSTSSAQFSQVSDLRRAKQRKGWEPLVADEPASPSSDFLAFPRERLGNHYALNWALNSSKITPSGNAYRNLHLRGLLMLCSGAKEQNKAIRVDTRPGIAADDFIQVASKSPEFADTLRDVRRYFSHVPDIFVHDGEIGSKHTQSLSIRVIADSAATGLWCHHRISRIPLSDPRAFRPALTVYVATNIAKPPSVVCDLEAGVVVINNVNSTETLEQAILTAFSVTAPDTVAEKSFSILLKSSVFYPQPNHIDLIISSPSHPLPAAPADLFSSDATIWSSQGLSRVFEGYSLPNTVPPLPHALITSQQTTASFSTQPPPLIAAPTRVFVLGDNQKGVQTSRIPKDKVAEFATQIHPLLPQVIGDIACHRLSLSSSSSWAQIRSALLAQSKSK